jgi:hypothetical protein
MSIKRLARQLYYTGKTTRVPSEEEETELISKYNLPYKHQPSFNSAISNITAPVKKPEPANDRHALADVVDDFEELFKVDIKNLSTRQFVVLEDKIAMVKEYFIAKIRRSEMSDWYKQSLIKDIEECETASSILVLLYYRVAINE